MFVDVWKRGNKWQRIKLSEVKPLMDKGDECFITWLRYVSEVDGQHGAMLGNMVYDFDDADNPENARIECRRLYNTLTKDGVKEKNLRIYFSGKKGFHLEIDYRAFLDRPYDKLPVIYKWFYYRAVKDGFKTLDKGMYITRRQWRLPNTKHSGSGLYCIQITYDQLNEPLQAIKKLAEKPRPINSKEFEHDPAMKKMFDRAFSWLCMSTQEMQKRMVRISMVDGALPPCVSARLAETNIRGNRNNMIYDLACSLKYLKFDLSKAIETIAPFCENNAFSIKEAEATINSAYSKAETYLSCNESSVYCQKDLCDNLQDDDSVSASKDLVGRFVVSDNKSARVLVRQKETDGFYKQFVITGIEAIDRLTHIFKDHITVIGSNTNEGKTSFLVTILKANPDKRCLFLPIEEGVERTARRMIKSCVSKDIDVILPDPKGEVTGDDVRNLIKAYKPDYIIIDQLINVKKDAETERLKYRALMEDFRLIAKEYCVPFFIAHQLNRMAINTDLPHMGMLAEGADVERLSYDTWILFRRKVEDFYYNFINIAKTKTNASGYSIPIKFNSRLHTFEDYAGEILPGFDKHGVDENFYLNGSADYSLPDDDLEDWMIGGV
jgi:hypothetical protein